MFRRGLTLPHCHISLCVLVCADIRSGKSVKVISRPASEAGGTVKSARPRSSRNIRTVRSQQHPKTVEFGGTMLKVTFFAHR